MKRGVSLHTRLIVGVLLLTGLGLTLAAVATNYLLRSYLVSQVDRQLLGAPRFADRLQPLPGAPPGGQRQPQLPSPFVVTRLSATGEVIDQSRGSQVADAPAPDVVGLTLADVQALQGAPFDVSGVDDASYSYRAVAVPLADGSGSVVVAVSTESIDSTTRDAAIASLAVGLVTLGLVALLAGSVIRVGLRPLDEVEQTAERIAAGDLSQRVPDMPEGTEIGRLAASLNGMLGQIEGAFSERAASEDRLRRFVSDASHALRTPLTSIRGYAELTRSGAFSSDEERARAAGRIEEEAARMGVLVDDLLLLARLDQQRPLEQEPVDVVSVVGAAADALRAAAPDRDVTVESIESAVVEGDALRLRQAIDNLATNARVHTTPGSPIAFVVDRDGDVVRLEVRDSGPGMDDAEVTHAFERFYRGDPSRNRARGAGTGLGLSIASAVVAAHGGSVELESSPAAGTTVTLRLPLAAVPAPVT